MCPVIWGCGQLVDQVSSQRNLPSFFARTWPHTSSYTGCVHIHYMQIHRRYTGCVCAVWRIPGIFSSLLLALHDDWFCKRFIIRYNMIFLFFLKTCLHAHTHAQAFIHEYLSCLAMRVGVCTKCSWLGLCPDAHMLAGRAGHMAIWWKVEIQPIDFDLLSCFCNGRFYGQWSYDVSFTSLQKMRFCLFLLRNLRVHSYTTLFPKQLFKLHGE